MSTVAAVPSRPESAATDHRLTYLPGLDGLRAISVAAVLLYHADLAWIPGGFLGVEVFFVISGYLITLLMLNERERTGMIDLRNFWLRRARRLLPALYTLLALVALYSVVFLRDELARLREDILAAFFYVTNWYLIVSESSYFDRLGRPSLLRHLWSLAVEEQFYLLWPIAMWVMLRLFGSRLKPMAITIASGVMASTLLMAILYSPGKD
ncbi:MAG TPA: acyltransferase, partial [Acidimicrobiales bacterium]